MKKATIIVMVVTILSKILGFFRDLTLLRFFGYNEITDAFNVATTIPNSVLAIVGAALVTGIIPMLTRINAEDKERGDRFTSNVMNIMILFCVILMTVMFIFPEAVIKVFAAQLTPQAVIYASAFLRIIAFGVISIAVVQLGSGYLNVKQNFIIPAFITIPSNIIVISGIFLANRTNNYLILGYGQLLALIVQASIIFVYMKKSGFNYRFIVDFKDKDLRHMVTLALPLLLASVLGVFNDVAMKSFATTVMPEGGYSYMTSATKLIGLVSGIFVTAILNVTYPTIAESVVRKDNKMINKSVNDAILMMLVFIIPAMVGFVTMAEPIVKFVYFRGEVNVVDVAIIVPIFIGDTFALLAIGMRDLLSRIHYAHHDMKSPVKNVMFMSVMFVILMVIFRYVFGLWGMPLAGLSFAYAVSMTIAMIPFFYSAKRLIGKTYFRYILKDLVKILGAGLLMGVATVLMRGPILGMLGGKIGLIVVIGIAALVYFVLLIAFRTNFVLSLISSFIYKENEAK